MSTADGFRRRAFDLKTRSIKRSAGSLYQELLVNQHLPHEQLEQLASARAGDIASFAFRESPFYRRLYRDAGVAPQDLREPASWSHLPIIERTDIKQNLDDVWSSEANEKTRVFALTGGSTGQPVRTGYDRRVDVAALSWRMYGWWGIHPWDSMARIGRYSTGRLAAMKQAAAWWPTRLAYLDASAFDPQSMSAFYRQIRRIRPSLIEGFVGALTEFAEYVAANGLVLDPPAAVGSTAAPLTDPVRRRLQAVFNAPVYDQYRSAEVQWMAGECSEQNGLHVSADMRRIEILDEDGEGVPPGEVGDLVVTDFSNRVFPIIRYRIGDRGSWVAGDCACGVSLPRIAQPEGRVSDILRLPDGSVLAHRLMAMFSGEPDAVRLFQIHQHADYAIEIRVVLGDTNGARAAVDRAVDVLRDRVKRQVPVTVTEVQSLPYTRGKIKYLISDVDATKTGP